MDGSSMYPDVITIEDDDPLSPRTYNGDDYSYIDAQDEQYSPVSTQSSRTITNSPALSSRKRKADNISGSSTPQPNNKRRNSNIYNELDGLEFTPGTIVLPDDGYSPYIIAYSVPLQEKFREHQLASGVQWEMARLLSLDRCSYDEISPSVISALVGTNDAAAEKAARILTGTIGRARQGHIALDAVFAREIAAKTPWPELDKEEAAQAKDPFAGLGHSEEYSPWFGGRVQYIAKLQGSRGQYKIVLERCALGHSCRFTRRFGSWSFIRLKIPTIIFYDKDNKLEGFCRRPLVLWGRIFRACYAKDQTVFYFRTNEIYNSTPEFSSSEMSLESFINWHNPLEHNADQPMSKWASRFALGFSTSVPGPKIDPSQVTIVQDVVQNGSDMTDGCGYSNKPVHIAIYRRQCLEEPPAAFQFRLAGYKGMSMLNTDNQAGNDLQMFFRLSQIKIRYPLKDPSDPAKCIIDLIRTSRLRTPTRIATEIIVNLAENGVPHDVFVDIMKNDIEEMVKGFTTWDSPEAMLDLWSYVERDGSVVTTRLARELGRKELRDQSDSDDEDDEFDLGLKLDPAIDQRSTAWWADVVSGCPASLWDTVLVLLDSGFAPAQNQILREKLHKVVLQGLDKVTQQYRFELKYSLRALVVPDICNVLGPNQIHVKSSRRDLVMPDGLKTDILVGDILITRNPCKLPSDVRKVQAIEHPALREYIDVIVCTVNMERRLLDYLAGGDYDGDACYVIWDPRIVSPFRNANDKHSVEPAGLELSFTREIEKVSEVLKNIQSQPSEIRERELQKHLLGALSDTSLVGQYSTMHDNAIYKLGYDHPRTVRLAYKFCKVLDSPKTGWKIKPESLKEDKARYSHARGPEWKGPMSSRFADKSNMAYLERPAQDRFIKGPFIMDTLRAATKAERDLWKGKLDTIFSTLSSADARDPHLTSPWETALLWAERGNAQAVEQKKKDLQAIQSHVETMYTEHRIAVQQIVRQQHKKPIAFRSPSSSPIEPRQDIIRSISRRFAESPSLDDLETIVDKNTLDRLRASCAFTYDTRCSRFPWDVAMRELCAIKANAIGSAKTVTGQFYDRFRLIKRR